MNNIIVTAGNSYLDMDAYACCVAYARLLQHMGHNAFAASSGTPNYSVPRFLYSDALLTPRDVPSGVEYSYVIVDVSDPSHLDRLVNHERISEIFDHHHGFQDYWTAKLADKAHIEWIGAASTLIYEAWSQAGYVDSMTPDIARLLLAGILDNTLNLQSQNTTLRDRDAAKTLSKIGMTDADWATQYFSTCQQQISHRLESALRMDFKYMESGQPIPRVFAQLTVWNADQLLKACRENIQHILSQLDACWFLNLISIENKRSIFLVSDRVNVDDLQQLLGVGFQDNIAVSDRLWLRKEIIKLASGKYSKAY